MMSVDDTLQQAVEVKSETTDTINTALKLDTALFPLANRILELLKTKNYTSLSEYALAKKGIRFSPYAYIDLKRGKVLTIQQLNNIDTSKKHVWGTYDGSGDPIKLTVPEYFDRFVYNANFQDSAQMLQNDFVRKGNTINNLKEIYPGCDFVEFSYPIDPRKEGINWSSLRLVFLKENEKIYLVAIVHDQWTI